MLSALGIPYCCGTEFSATYQPKWGKQLACFNYEVLARLGVTTGSVICRAQHLTTLAQVLLKLPRPDDPAPGSVAALRREFELLKSLSSPGVARPVRLIEDAELPSPSFAVVLEAFPGESLEAALGASPIPWRDGLRLSRAMLHVVAALHTARIVHKDLRPANFLVDWESCAVCLVDVSVAAVGERGAPGPDAWSCIAPEQTGRLNRTVDHRADLYALGITMYRMLTGRMPFVATDALEWIHCHVARVPQPPVEQANMPEIVSDMVMKLLAKSPDDRYQSAAGVLFDIDRCLAELPVDGSPLRTDTFDLATHDVPEQLQISQKLYGRDAEMNALREAFERVWRSGQTELALISGSAGSGKTALVGELQKAVVVAHGIFIAGKFDQQRRDVPYATLAQAFGELIKQILSEGEARIAEWRDKLMQALGANAQLMVELIAPLELILGSQPPVLPLGLSEARNRFRMVFRQFVGAIALERPLVLFLDDLQWADAASLDLLQDLSTGSGARGFLVIWAYRDDEVPSTHPLQLLFDQLRQEQTPVTNIVLGPLTPANLRAFVADALHLQMAEVAPLADLIGERTGGNAFFSIQFLLELAHEGQLAFDHQRVRWVWHLDAIRAKGYTRNVVDLMTGKLARLPPRVQQVLQHAACLGNGVEAGLVAAALDMPLPDTENHLATAVRAGLLQQVGSAYHFAHDRFQEAAYALIPESERPGLHLRMGRILLAQLPPAALEERIFDVVNALNHGAPLMTDAHELATMRRLNVRAAQRAKAATAYAAAARFFGQAAAFLHEEAWQSLYEECFPIYTGMAECAFLSGNFERAENLLVPLFEHARSRIDHAQVDRLQIKLHLAGGRVDEAAAAAVEALNLFGLTLPEAAEDIERAIFRARQDIADLLQGRSALDLLSMTQALDPDVHAAVDLLNDSLAPVYLARPALYPLVCMSIVKLSLERGNCKASSSGYMGYANVLAAKFFDHPAASAFADLALRLEETAGGAAKGHVLFVHAGYIHHWRNPFWACRQLLDGAFASAMAFGDLWSACYCNLLEEALAIEHGELLDTLLEMAARHAKFVGRMGPVVGMPVRLNIQFARCLKGLTRGLNSLDDDGFQEADCLRAFEQGRVGNNLFVRHVLRQTTAFIAGEYASSLEFSRQAALLAPFLLGDLRLPSHHLFHLLSLAALFPDADVAQQEETRRIFSEKLPMYEAWALNCPQNYMSRWALAKAEFARIEGRAVEAQQAYEQAIESAHQNGTLHIEALACELASRFYAACKLRTPADAYLRRARACYAHWGADGKVRQLEAQHPQLRYADGAGVAAVKPEMLAIVKMSQAISSQIDLEELLDTLMRIALETAGAQKGLLMLAEPDRLSLAAEAAVQGQAIDVRIHPRANEADDELPIGILNYVRRSRERLMLADAGQPSPFSNDAYVARRRPKSILCLPLLRRAQLIGVLYLEHGLVSQAFSAGQAELLAVLASQAAISLETARLYASLQEREARIRRLVDANIIGILFFDLRGGILDANDALLRMLGYDRVDLRQGKLQWSDLTPSAHHELDGQKIAEVRRSGTCTPYEKEYFRKDGSRVPVLIGAALLEGSQEHGVAFVLDLSERKQAEVEREARRVADLANRAKSEFLANMSHELRTPLNSILGYAQLLRMDDGLTDRQRRGLETIKQGGEHLLALIIDILDLSRVEAGRLELYPSPVVLRDFLGSVVDIARIKAEQKDLDFVFEAASDVSGTALIDEKRLRQVLLNLLSNAIKFTDTGQVVLRVQALPVDPHRASSEKAATVPLRFEVRDTGIGMDKSQLARLFQPFEQVGEAKRREGGTGLGLAISRQLIRLMGGDIHVGSHEGQGSIFSFELDVPVTHEQANGLTSQPGIAIGYEGPRKTVLVVDDVEQNRTWLLDALEALGFQVSCASDGETCLRALRLARPDLIVMDLAMPVMDGWEATQRIRLLPEYADLPIICTSASVTPEVGVRSLDMGANAFIPKPIEQELLLKAMGRLMNLNWIHRNARPQPAAQARRSPALLYPPSEEMVVLRELARMGNMQSLRERSVYLEKLDARYAPFAARLAHLAEGYQSKAIASLVESDGGPSEGH